MRGSRTESRAGRRLRRAARGWRSAVPLLTGIAAAWAALPGAPHLAAQLEVEAGVSREVLTGESDWEDYWIRATWRRSPRTHAWGGVRHTRRFGEEDQQFEVGGGLPLGARWSLAMDGSWSPTHRVLPVWSAFASLHRALPGGWGVFFGGGYQSFQATDVTHQHAGVERWLGPVRLSYRLSAHQVQGGGSGVHHLVAGTWSYGDGSSATVGLGAGREAVLAGVGDVRSIGTASATLWGTHWLDARTGISYTLTAYRHGDLFTRTGVSVGVRRRL